MSEIVKRRIKPSTIVLFISLLPYLLLIVYGVYCAFTGFEFFTTRTYGFTGFCDAILISAVLMTVYEPILPVCLAYQGCYIVRKAVRPARRVSYTKYWAVCAVVCILVGILFYAFLCRKLH